MKKQVAAAVVAVCALACHVQAGCGEGAGGIELIPTLGGSTYWVSAVNANGELTGLSFLPGESVAHAFIYGDTGIQSLGTLGGATSQGNDLNSAGQVVGNSSLASGTHAFLYSAGTMLDLGTLGGSFSTAVGINDLGQVAGFSTRKDFATEAFLFADGQMQALGSLGGGDSWANAINNQGTVVGDSYDLFWRYRAFLFDGEEMIDLGALGEKDSAAVAVNDSDMVVGDSSTLVGETHAFLWTKGEGMVDLGTLGGGYSEAIDISEAGHVIGVSTTEEGETHAFLYESGSMLDLGSLGGGYSEPRAVNSLGQVVGASTTTDGFLHAFAWQNGIIVDLNSLLASTTQWELTSAEFINEVGHIVGYGYYNGIFSWFRLSPGNPNTPPVAVAGIDLLVECGQTVTLDGSGSSDPDGDALSFEWSMGGVVLSTTATYSGVFPLGNNAVLLKVTDPCGAEAQAGILVVVKDTAAPEITQLPSNLSAAADANCQAAIPDVLGSVTAFDQCSAALSYSQNPSAGTLVGLGVHQVSVLVTDASGNTTTAQVIFTVEDKTAPVISNLAVTPSEILVPNHQMVPVTCSLQVLDNCDPAATARIISITCNEQFAPEEVQFTGALTASLAATRNPAGEGRVYTLTLEARDSAGNTSESSVQVTVAKGNGGSKSAETLRDKTK